MLITEPSKTTINKQQVNTRNLLYYVYTISSLLFVCISSSCTHKTKPFAEKQDTIVKSVFSSKKVKIKFDSIGLAPPASVPLGALDDKLIVRRFNGDKVVAVFDGLSGKELGEFVDRGNDKNQLIEVSDFIKDDRKGIIWFFDASTQKIQKYNIGNGAIETWQPLSEIKLRNFLITSPAVVNDSVFSGISWHDTSCRFLTISNSSTLISKTGKLPPPKEDWPENSSSQYSPLKYCYGAFLKKAQNQDVYAVFYKFIDRVEIYKNNKLQRIVRGPDVIDPQFTFTKKAGVYIPHRFKNTKVGYIDATITDNMMLGLYSGRRAPSANTILVFDLNGNLIKQLDFDIQVSNFAVTVQSNRLIVYSIKDNVILKASIVIN